ncbi:hypothetical protein V502_04112 [Pseudogymnoascus sp. VKM F-4520 (FW-2644)]|nr:hypothetical protein V502_04112 [Pseudogymnoascus sp. VKM F-4520 (FW-2644)]
MQFPKLAAIIGSLSAMVLATPTPDLPVATRALPQIRLCKDAQYKNCINKDVTVGTCQDLDKSWNDAISSIDFHTPDVGTCVFYQDYGCEGDHVESDYNDDDHIANLDEYGFNDQISSFICDGVA